MCPDDKHYIHTYILDECFVVVVVDFGTTHNYNCTVPLEKRKDFFFFMCNV